MAKKIFLTFLAVLLVTFAFGLLIKFYRPDTSTKVDIGQFPLQIDGWNAETLPLSQNVLDLLDPDAILMAYYTNQEQLGVELFFSYFSSENTSGGLHSPRNCMPGSGWAITQSEEHAIQVGDRTIPATRLHIKFGAEVRIVDFWYITRHGETSNDYMLKFYQMLSALTLRPTDVAFVRLIATNRPEAVAALERFERTITPEIYEQLTFN
jgi:EpsI family protein